MFAAATGSQVILDDQVDCTPKQPLCRLLQAVLSAKFHISNGTDLFVTVTVCDLEENPGLLMLSSTCVFPFMTNMKMDPASFMTKQSSVT